jgi:HK97 family phage prohead protease
VPGAFKASIAAWAETGRRVPLHWDHRGEASNIIGSIDPNSMVEMEEGLFVEGKLGISESEVAREVWRSVKNNTVGLSFGYPVKADRQRNDGVRELLALDLYEISLTGAPANPNARVLSTKGLPDVRIVSFEC